MQHQIPKSVRHLCLVDDLAPGSRPVEESKPSWKLEELAGRLVEISAQGQSALLSFAARLLHQAQRQGESCAWLSFGSSLFYPPDLHAQGIDLGALPLVCAPDFHKALHALERLLRSGAFGCLVLDLGIGIGSSSISGSNSLRFPLHAQGRLANLAKKHHTAVLALSEKDESQESMGSMVSLHAQALRKYEGQGRYRGTLRATKDKHCGPYWTDSEFFCAPPGLY